MTAKKEWVEKPLEVVPQRVRDVLSGSPSPKPMSKEVQNRVIRNFKKLVKGNLKQDTHGNIIEEVSND